MPSPAISTSTASAAASALVAGLKDTSGVMRARPLHQHGHRVFDMGLEGREQLGAERAVDDAVIDRERDTHHGRDLESIVLDDWALLAAADGEDRGLRRVNDGVEAVDAVHAEIGDRGRAALILVRREPLRAGAGGEIAHLVRDLRQALDL